MLRERTMARTPDIDALSPAFPVWLGEQLGASEVALSGFEIPSHGGLSNDTILCDVTTPSTGSAAPAARKRRLVIRIEPAEPIIFPRYDLDAQFRVIQVLGEKTDIPVPGVLGYESSPEVLGRPFYVMECVAGRIPSDDPPFLLKGWLHDASADQQATAQQSVVEALARLHGLDWQALGLGFVDRPEFGATGLDQQFGYWRQYLDWASEAHALPVLEAAFEWCAAHRPAEPGQVVFNWGDARLGNVIYADDFRPAAILDWEMALLGPAELDLGWFLFIHETALMWMKDLPGFRDRNAVIELYQQSRGRELHDLHFYEAWAGFRCAAIQTQLVVRDQRLGADVDLAARERNPILKSLRRLIDLPRP